MFPITCKHPKSVDMFLTDVKIVDMFLMARVNRLEAVDKFPRTMTIYLISSCQGKRTVSLA